VSRRRINRPNVPCVLIALVLSITLWCHVNFIKQDSYHISSEILKERPDEYGERELTVLELLHNAIIDATEGLL